MVYDDPVIHFRDAALEAAGKPNLLQVNGYLYQETDSHYVMIHEVDVGDGTNEPIWSQVPKACVKAVYQYGITQEGQKGPGGITNAGRRRSGPDKKQGTTGA